MSANMDDLKKTFSAAVNYFNGDNFKAGGVDFDTTLGPLFDENAAMKKIDDQQAYHSPKTGIKTYFLGTGSEDKARFTPNTTDSPPACTIVDSFDLGFVSGTGWFVDNTNPPSTPPRRIAYSFTFTRKSGTWKALHLWGKYID